MKEISAASFASFITTNELFPLYVFYGPETFFHDEFVRLLENKIFKDKSEKDFNYQVFYGSESSSSEIVSSCMAYPMLASRKLVVVRQFGMLKIDDQNSFLKYIKNPQQTTTLVLVSENRGKSKFYNDIFSAACTVKCQTLYAGELLHWVKSKLKTMGRQAEEEVLSFLIENTGHDLLRINTELDKIANFVNQDAKITRELVAQITGFTRDVNIFNLQKELAAQKLENSLKLALRLLDQGESLAAILPMIFLFFQRMLIVKELVLKGLHQKQIISTLGGSPYYYRDIFNFVKNFDLDRLIAIIEQIEHAELQLKTSFSSEKSILSMLCYFICKN